MPSNRSTRKATKPVSAQTLNNLCVAHTVLRQFDEALETCDAAVASANAKRAEGYRPGVSRQMLDQSAAVAYSNRAVLHLLSRDTLAAQNDLASARAISPRAFYVMRNLGCGRAGTFAGAGIVRIPRVDRVSRPRVQHTLGLELAGRCLHRPASFVCTMR